MISFILFILFCHFPASNFWWFQRLKVKHDFRVLVLSVTPKLCFSKSFFIATQRESTQTKRIFFHHFVVCFFIYSLFTIQTSAMLLLSVDGAVALLVFVCTVFVGFVDYLFSVETGRHFLFCLLRVMILVTILTGDF